MEVERVEHVDEVVRVPVLIVGGGPVGLLLAILLDAQGVDSLVVERRTEVQAAPAAHVINARTFEICRAAGLDAEVLERACQPAADGAWGRWVTSLVGPELGKVPFERQDELDALLDVTPTPLRNLSQHRFEPILRDHLATLDHPRLAMGREWVTGEQDESGVVSLVRDVRTGEEQRIESAWVVAADGAGSPVRRHLGLAMDGPTRLKATISIHVEADLRTLVADRPATLYWVTDPACEGVFVAHDHDRTWVFMHDWDPDTEAIEDYTVERCTAIFRRAMGTDEGSIVVRSISPWMMSCQVAERYGDGRVFLAGDAAHRFPPTGGLGLNTGAADAHNLAWKLGAVIRGEAGPDLLRTYEAERRPIAETNAAQSLENAIKTLEVVEALADQTDERSNRIAQAIEDQAPHFDMLGLQLGAVYPPPGSVDDGTPLVTAADPVRDHRPTTHPGARLPHAWVARGDVRLSTLDLIPLDRFVLLTASIAWAGAGEKVRAAGVPLDVVVLGDDVTDPAGAWSAVSELPAGGALLVRPDQHVLWRTPAERPDAEEALHAALASLLARD